MEKDTIEITPGRGSAEGAAWFRERLAALNLSQGALTRLMLDLGDDRREATIARCVSRMASGEARVSGEMRALLGLLDRHKSDLQPSPQLAGTGRSSAA